jgi:hypothetical protein
MLVFMNCAIEMDLGGMIRISTKFHDDRFRHLRHLISIAVVTETI